MLSRSIFPYIPCACKARSGVAAHAHLLPHQRTIKDALDVSVSHLVLGPVVEEQVDADEEEQGDDEGLRVLESERLQRAKNTQSTHVFCGRPEEGRKEGVCLRWGDPKVSMYHVWPISRTATS